MQIFSTSKWTSSGHATPIDPLSVLLPDHIELKRETLVASWSAETNQVAVPEPDTLSGFIALREADDENILRFAQIWGMLGNAGRGPGEMWEACSHWRREASQFGALLRIGKDLQSGNTAAPGDWDEVGQRGESVTSRSLAQQQIVFCDLLQHLLTRNHVGPVVRWTTRLEFSIGATTVDALIAPLSVQLTLAIANAKDLATCSGCGAVYIPSRRPSEQRRNYCVACRSAGVPMRDSKRERRQRLRESGGRQVS